MKNSLNGTRYLYRRIILNDSYRQSLNTANFLYVLRISSFDIGIYDVSNNQNHTLHDSDNDKYYNHCMSDFGTKYPHKPSMYFAPLSNLGEAINKMSYFKT